MTILCEVHQPSGIVAEHQAEEHCALCIARAENDRLRAALMVAARDAPFEDVALEWVSDAQTAARAALDKARGPDADQEEEDCRLRLRELDAARAREGWEDGTAAVNAGFQPNNKESWGEIRKLRQERLTLRARLYALEALERRR